MLSELSPADFKDTHYETDAISLEAEYHPFMERNTSGQGDLFSIRYIKCFH